MRKSRPLQWIEEAEARKALVDAAQEASSQLASTTRKKTRAGLAGWLRRCVSRWVAQPNALAASQKIVAFPIKRL